MNIERRNQIRQPVSGRRMAGGDEMIACAPQPDVGQPQRFPAAVCDKGRSRRHDSRRAARRQRVEIGIDDGMLNLGKRTPGVNSALGSRLRPRQQQAVAGPARSRPAID